MEWIARGKDQYKRECYFIEYKNWIFKKKVQPYDLSVVYEAWDGEKQVFTGHNEFRFRKLMNDIQKGIPVMHYLEQYR